MPVTRCLARHRALATRNYREAPVTNLPMELLSEIFHVGLDEHPLDDQRVIKYLGTISSTCSAWRNAALGTPSLWQRIIYTDPKPKPKGPAIPRHTKDRLLAYLLRSKNCSIRLHLTFGTSPLIMRAIKQILDPHLPRCLSISLIFSCQPDAGHFLPLPGNLCRLTEFSCTHEDPWEDQMRICPMFAEPVYLQKLILNICPPVDSINTRNLEVVRLMQPWNQWPTGLTLLSRCHSLTTLIMTDGIPFGTVAPVAPFTLPNLIYLDTVFSTVLTVVHTPNLQTLILREVSDHEFARFVLQPRSWPALTTLCCIYIELNPDGIRSLLGSSPHIKRLILLACSGIMQSLKTDDTAWLPSLRLLQVFGEDGYVIGLVQRPTLRIEYGAECGSSYMDADDFKAKVELGYDNEPGVFKLDSIGSRKGAEQQAVSVNA